jgi:hypothetical protein
MWSALVLLIAAALATPAAADPKRLQGAEWRVEGLAGAPLVHHQRLPPRHRRAGWTIHPGEALNAAHFTQSASAAPSPMRALTLRECRVGAAGERVTGLGRAAASRAACAGVNCAADILK